MNKTYTFWVGLIWLPITITFMYYTQSWLSFGLLMVGLIAWIMGEPRSQTTSNYRLGGYESHTYDIPPTPFSIGTSYMGGVLFVGWIIINLIRWGA